MKHEQQDHWDQLVFVFYEQGSVKQLVWRFLTSIGMDRSDYGKAIEELRSQGLKRLPLAKEGEQWLNVYRSIPVSAWLARGISGSMDLFFGKSDEERVEIFARLKVKILSGKNSQRRRSKRRAELVHKGARFKIKARSLDKRSDWRTVK